MKQFFFLGGSAPLTNTTEIFKNGSFVAGPVMPVAVSGHCMFRVNTTHFMMTGGILTGTVRMFTVRL